MKAPILRDFPDHFETERLLIRAPRPGDGAAVNAAIVESQAELQPWMPWAIETPPPEATEEFIRQGAANWITRDDLTLLLFRKEDGMFVGGSGLHRIIWRVPAFEIGYWCRTSLTGRGYITEAVVGITRFAFETLGAERVEIRCDAANERSAAVARRAGYTQEARLRRHDRGVNDELRDTLVFSIIRPEYDERFAGSA